MEARYAIRKAQLLEECQVAPEVFLQFMPRLQTFMAPFVDTLQWSSPPGACPDLCRGPALGCRTQEHRIDRLSFWPGALGVARLYRLGRLG